MRSLLLCKTCWLKVPEPLRLEAINARKSDPKSVVIGELAAKVVVAAVRGKPKLERKVAT